MTGQGVAGILASIASLFPPTELTFVVLLSGCAVITAVAQVLYVWQLKDHQMVQPILENIAADRKRISVDAFTNRFCASALFDNNGRSVPKSPLHRLSRAST